MTLHQQLKKLQEEGMWISEYDKSDKLKEKLFFALYQGPVEEVKWSQWIGGWLMMKYNGYCTNHDCPEFRRIQINDECSECGGYLQEVIIEW